MIASKVNFSIGLMPNRIIKRKNYVSLQRVSLAFFFHRELLHQTTLN